MGAAQITSQAAGHRARARAKPMYEIVGSLLPLSLVRFLLLPLAAFLAFAAIALAFDQGYTVELMGLVMLLALRGSYRAGLREGEYREAFRQRQREYTDRRRRVLGEEAEQVV